jgi:hypothetical protein
MQKNLEYGFDKIALIIKMPDKSTELIINSEVESKVNYIKNAYNDDLQLKNNNEIEIIDYVIIPKLK